MGNLGIFHHPIRVSLIGNADRLDADLSVMQILDQSNPLGGGAFSGLFLTVKVSFWTIFNRAEGANSVWFGLYSR